MTELEEQCTKLFRFINQSVEKSVQSFDYKVLDQLILEHSKLEGVMLQTSNNLNRCLLEADNTNGRLKEITTHIK